MKKFISAIFVAVLMSCGSPQNSDKSGDSTATTGSDTTVASGKADANAPANWDYSDEEDKMTSAKKYFAVTSSTNKLEFDFPYDGGSTAGITVRNMDGVNEVVLTISKGQFVSDISDGAVIKARFDQDKALTFTASSASDGSSDVLFIHPAKKFIKELKSAKTLIVQAEFYESGVKDMEFNVADFKWEH